MKLTAITGLAALSACLLFADSKTDYSHHTNFANFHTYSWIKVQASDPLWDNRIKSAVESQLNAKGWREVPSGGDVSIAAYGSTHEKQSLQTVYDGFGGGWYWRGFGGNGLSTTTPIETPVGSLTVDIFNSSDKKLIWRGTSTQTLTDKPEKNEKKLDKDVAEMFKNFPPESKG